MYIRKVVLFPPSDLQYLYYIARPKGQLKYEYPSRFQRSPDAINPEAVIFGSSVSMDAPDMTRHPLFERASPLRIVLEPGDILYLPAFWHHEVL